VEGKKRGKEKGRQVEKKRKWRGRGRGAREKKERKKREGETGGVRRQKKGKGGMDNKKEPGVKTGGHK